MPHSNAPLTVEGRRRLCERVDAGRPICHVAAEAGIARQTLGKWHHRWRFEGVAGLSDRSSRPAHCPTQIDPQIEDVVEWLRRGMKLGAVMLVAELRHYGIELARLDDRADPAGAPGDLFVSGAVHQARIVVDDHGVEAAAATAVGVAASASSAPPVVLRVDRPFVYLIHDLETVTPLFLGRVSDPTAG